ncbi:alpha/beta fold hydrolase [Paenarthrobacter sp. NPDC092416]|uniref:alpha/beta fold hydrolase n=1 Tax=Paenarthrobacter sp. NPDC092416 TaxID=3364386 RepID=UPI0037F8A36A
MGATRAIFLPGSVLPAAPAYSELIHALGPDVDAVAKDLEIYETAEPSPTWSLDTEVDGVLREADAKGWDTFHLIGYSGGGSAALAFTAKHPERLLSVTLLEAAWAGDWDWSPAHSRLWKEFEDLESLPPDQYMAAFARLGVKPDVVLPPPPADDPPPWMAKRPAGIKAFLRDFETYHLDRERLAAFPKPVLFVIGGLSNPDQYGDIADRLSKVFPDFLLEEFAERHHFDPPHRIEPERLARILREHWTRAEEGKGGN